MKIYSIAALLITIGLICAVSLGQDKSDKTTPSQDSKQRQIWITLKSGQVVTGTLVKMDTETIDFIVKDILQSFSLNDGGERFDMSSRE